MYFQLENTKQKATDVSLSLLQFFSLIYFKQYSFIQTTDILWNLFTLRKILSNSITKK